MTILQLPSPGALSAGDLDIEWPEQIDPVAWQRRLLRYLRGDRAFPQLIRFALVGGLSNISYVLLFLSLTGAGPLLANVAGSVVSTILANELHRRFTFHAAERVGWFTAQWEGGGLALLGLGISTAALAALEFSAPTLPEPAQAAAVLAISAAVGGLRFLALRGLVFGPLRRAREVSAARAGSAGALGEPVQ
ncbi:GtrA family protein [Nocardia flavorosea]|uniref:GtrA family protein n=1 Tax=Nocardia flavorosea TaxID=53429 RepID=A0A846YRF1_9NOCA|nr:GtrA family protein [Nocardia flavorosea]NKY59549.1 GtrA family protein [Nocardia flavorosea]